MRRGPSLGLALPPSRSGLQAKMVDIQLALDPSMNSEHFESGLCAVTAKSATAAGTELVAEDLYLIQSGHQRSV